MSFLPIVERELRVRGKARKTYHARLFAAIAATVFATFVLLATEATHGARTAGDFLFQVMSWAVFLFCLMQGLRNTADCLSEEKRAGTLGLLFLTDLRGYDVTIGKLVAASVSSFYGLLAVLPPLSIPLVLGGVTVGEFWRMVLALIVTLLFAVTAGLFISSMSRDARHAWNGTFALTGLFIVAVPLLQRFIDLPISPACAFMGWRDSSYSSVASQYWPAIWSSVLISIGFVSAASLILPRSWQEKPDSARRMRRSVARRAMTSKQREARRRLLEAQPVVWLASRSGHSRFPIWILIVSASTLGLFIWFLTKGTKEGLFGILAVILLANLILSMWVASEACAMFPKSQESGALELLITTPLTVRAIVDGHSLALTRKFQGPLIAMLLVVGLFLAIHTVQGIVKAGAYQDIVFPTIVVALCMASSVMDLFAVSAYGMWAGLIGKNTGWAVSKTILLVLVLPLLSLACCTFAWPVIGILKNLVFISYAQSKLQRHFRTVVTERYGSMEGGDALPRQSRRSFESRLPPVIPR